MHRHQEGCAKCHAGIDPWGIAFERYDAGGKLKQALVDARATFPDGTEVQDLKELKAYLVTDRMDRVAFSFLKHLAGYATGRSLSYNEIVFLEEEVVRLKSMDYRMQDLLRYVVKSDMFLKK